MKTLQELMPWLEARVVQDGACLIWQHANRGGVPQAQLPNEQGEWRTVNVRRIVWEAKFGRPPKRAPWWCAPVAANNAWPRAM